MNNEKIENLLREQRTFFILQREREMSKHAQGRENAALGAGLCILGASAAALLSSVDLNTAIQTQLHAIYSWESLGEHFQNIGPLSTMLAVGAGGFIAKYLGHNKKFKTAREQLIDLNNSLVINSEKGGKENARTR